MAELNQLESELEPLMDELMQSGETADHESLFMKLSNMSARMEHLAQSRVIALQRRELIRGLLSSAWLNFAKIRAYLSFVIQRIYFAHFSRQCEPVKQQKADRGACTASHAGDHASELGRGSYPDPPKSRHDENHG